MLNISNNRIEGKIIKSTYSAFGMVKDHYAHKTLARLIYIFIVVFCIILFLPWTQNIRSKGVVTTLKPDQRPQSINSVIAGRIEDWYVVEGDFVEQGDTIVFLSEIKDEYFDPNLLTRTEEQIESKELAVVSYMDKVKSLDRQIDAMINTKRLKIEQALNKIKQADLKIQSDSIKLEAAITGLNIAKLQFERMQELYDDGLKSLTDLEERKNKYLKAQSDKINSENDLLTSQNERINAQVELSSIENQFLDKVSKAESEKFASLSNMYDAEAVVTKMQNQYMNYSVRTGFYYITAPQSGYVTKTIRAGIGETLKEGEEIVTIMPAIYQLAVSMYVEPMDMPLINIGQEVRFMFDGWPSIVFSGWPNLSYGTFGGKVVAIDNFISPNGMYRLLVAPDEDDVEWPTQLRIGAGANGLALLTNVPIWYELWRNLNGFPPDYYQVKASNPDENLPKEK
jgi:multidrug resistance efflux pump